MKIFKIFSSALCVLGLSVPLNAMAVPTEEAVDIFDEQIEQSTEGSQGENDYHLAFLNGDLGLQVAGRLHQEPLDSLILFVSDPQGKIVKDAQVINTIIDQEGGQKMSRAYPYKGGYVVGIDHLSTGRYRLETEIITGGQLLTDEFSFFKA